MGPFHTLPVETCCTISRHRLAARAAQRAERIRAEDVERREQLRFERICARELLGEID